jgi:hypothetical protein
MTGNNNFVDQQVLGKGAEMASGYRALKLHTIYLAGLARALRRADC